MKFLKTKKSIAFSLSALILSAAVVGTAATYDARDVYAVTEATAPAEQKPTEPQKEETETPEKKVVLWKAQLSEYSSSLSLVNYEKVETEEEEQPEEETEEVQADEETVSEDDYTLEYTNGATTNEVPEREDVEYAAVESGNFGFTTYGYGHGLGMSQNGANFYASYGGWGYQSILAHYYPGTYIQNTGTAQSEVITAGGVSGSALDVVSMVVFNEMSDSMNVEAMKAQAVAAYSYIKYKNDNAPDLIPRSNPPEIVVNAVRQVLGEALYYNGSYALAMFGASSGGATASCYDIYYEDVPYLRSVPCDYDAQCDPHYGTVTSFSVDEVRYALEGNLGISLSDDPGNWIQIIEGDGGYVANVCVDGQVTIKGSDLKYYLGLKSPKFTCEYYY